MAYGYDVVATSSQNVLEQQHKMVEVQEDEGRMLSGWHVSVPGLTCYNGNAET